MANLREQGIVTKVRCLKTGRTIGGIPFTRGPLAHFLRNGLTLTDTLGHYRALSPCARDNASAANGGRSMPFGRRSLRASSLLFAVAACYIGSDALAASFEVKAFNTVTLKRTGQRCADDPLCINRLHPGIPMTTRAKPGDLIVFETRDATDSDFDLQTQFPRDLRLLDRNRVHPLTGRFISKAHAGVTCSPSRSSTSRPPNTAGR
jgi:hypothetical protein